MAKSNKTEKRLIKIGSKLKDLRIAKGYTSYENFAMEFDLDRKYYWSIEKGRNISLEYLFKLLEIHKIELKDFFSDLK